MRNRIAEMPSKEEFEKNITQSLENAWAEKMKISTVHKLELLLIDLNKWNETGKMTSEDLQASVLILEPYGEDFYIQ